MAGRLYQLLSNSAITTILNFIGYAIHFSNETIILTNLLICLIDTLEFHNFQYLCVVKYVYCFLYSRLLIVLKL